jgi:transposase InsO family protein
MILGLAERLERRHMHIARSAMADHGAAAKNWAAASMRCMGDRGGASTNSIAEWFAFYNNSRPHQALAILGGFDGLLQLVNI